MSRATELPHAQRVLAVGAHPDDVDLLCAGTLEKFRRQGAKVFIGIATNGDMGSMLLQPPELAKVREAEARASADVLGAELLWLGYPDEFLYDTAEARPVFIEMIRKAAPDLIITHTPDDYHPDHRAVSEAVFGASFVAAVPNVLTNTEVAPTIPPLYYMDSLGGVGFMPTDYVDITDTFDAKVRALECHESQMVWLKEYNDVDIIDFIEVTARFRGLACGARYAEGYRRAEVWPRVPSRRVLP
ncbi:MAG: PIG-L family deacetylase [Armatimonadetes bacterium]|nr:PIG-L family deacetylase [Armatimonadota bacterium]